MIALGPRSRRASSTVISCCPTWTPSAPDASATSTRSLTSNGILSGASAALMARASWTMGRCRCACREAGRASRHLAPPAGKAPRDPAHRHVRDRPERRGEDRRSLRYCGSCRSPARARRRREWPAKHARGPCAERRRASRRRFRKGRCKRRNGCGASISSSLRRHDPDQVRWVGSRPLSPTEHPPDTPLRLRAQLNVQVSCIQACRAGTSIRLETVEYR